jgi:hypothetical protein
MHPETLEVIDQIVPCGDPAEKLADTMASFRTRGVVLAAHGGRNSDGPLPDQDRRFNEEI